MNKLVDHKKIGQEQDLFLISQEVGSGFPIFTPKGFLLRRQVENYIVEEKEKRGYQFAWTPHLAKASLYKKSGHWQKYDSMFPPIELDQESYVLKPMNCPHHFQIYLNRPRSYKELPMRIAENSTVYRYEKSGEVNGLLRVRSLTIDDTHTFLQHNQISDELNNILELIEKLYGAFGFSNYRAQISVRDPKDKSKYLGGEDSWEKSEKALVEACEKRKIKYSIEEGEAAFYGPKIDVMVNDNLGREWQLSTCQLDFNQPENFDMVYINEKGEKERPAILHIAVLGSFERFIGILIEHYGGAFPVWLSPVQVKVLPITDKQVEYAKSVVEKLKAENIRTELDDRSETLPAKIRDAELNKIPYMIIVGDKEQRAKSVSLRLRTQKDIGQIKLEVFIRRIKTKIEAKSLGL
ncbi:MAG: threonine--tRNA ligase [Patescibacteria group bacterium]